MDEHERTPPPQPGAPARATQRVRVTGPRRGRPRRTSVASEIDAQTELGEIYMRSLIRSQLRLALGVVLVVLATVGALPVLFRTWPGLLHARLLGVPLPWLLLGLFVYPFLVLVARVYVRRAEHNERSFNDLVGPR
ncbi:MAG TPA: hypothetical protein VI452_14620 [Marmoricola sp.]